MGDVASGFLGFTFAVLPLLAAQTGKEDGRALIAGASFVGCCLVYRHAGQAASALAWVLALAVMLALFFGAARVERK